MTFVDHAIEALTQNSYVALAENLVLVHFETGLSLECGDLSPHSKERHVFESVSCAKVISATHKNSLPVRPFSKRAPG